MGNKLFKINIEDSNYLKEFKRIKREKENKIIELNRQYPFMIENESILDIQIKGDAMAMLFLKHFDDHQTSEFEMRRYFENKKGINELNRQMIEMMKSGKIKYSAFFDIYYSVD